MKMVPNWVCWNENKVPINPKSGQFAKPNDKNTWGTYQQACGLAEHHQELGIGFMIGDTDFIAIDLDDVDINDSELVEEFTKKINSYTEISPSGKGIHIWVKGTIEIYKYRKGQVEMYDKSTARYLTVTGNVYKEYKNINSNTEELLKLHKKYIDQEDKRNYQGNENQLEIMLDEEQVLSCIENSKQKDKFDRLFNGDWEGDYSSQSEADLALSNLLCFWTGKNYSLMDSMFRKSGLYRPKWDERRSKGTYGSYILNKAIVDTVNVYEPRKDNYSVSIAKKEEGDIQNKPATSEYVFETRRGYVKYKDNIPIPISTFIIELLEVINNDLDGELYYRCNFKSEVYKDEILFKAKEFNNKNQFMNLLQHPSFSFTGNQNDLQEIKKILSNQEYQTLRGVSYIGFHNVDDKRVFVTQDKTIDCQLQEVEGLTINEDHQAMTSNILSQEEITKEELILLSEHLFRFNELGITTSLISMMPVFMMKPLLFKENIKTQHLVIYGEAGAGKSQTIEAVLLPFFSLDKNDVLSCSNITQFSLLKSLSNTNALPVILEEYKPSFLSESQVRLISDNLRNTFDCHNATRGTRNQSLIVYPMLAPVVVIGEEGQEETAIKERSIILNFSKQGRQDKEKSFFFIKEHPGLISKLGRSILNKVLKMNTKDTVRTRNTLMKKYISEDITEDRVRESMGNLLLGFTVIANLYKDLGVNFENATGVNVQDIISVLNKNIFIEVLDESKNTKTIVDNTIEVFSSMDETGDIQCDWDYTVVNGTELALNITSLYPKLTKFIREYNVSTEIITSQRQFTKQLRKTAYFLDYKTVRFNGVSKRAYVLDIEKLQEKNIEIYGLLSEAYGVTIGNMGN